MAEVTTAMLGVVAVLLSALCCLFVESTGMCVSTSSN